MSQPIKSLLRNWGYSAAAAAWFISVLSIAWAIKPLYGLLTDFVPSEAQQEQIPCHFIPLNNMGETVDSMERHAHQLELEEALKNWLRSTIARLEGERCQKTQH